ncbi:MAG: hypothetical protein JRD05_01525 [Deltaproteobacteria bacterium]|nr:hypothetical protein [Deltaproteobacteria bacterium]
MVRVLHSLFRSAGLTVWSHITGVVPFSLENDAAIPIERSAPANIREMRWWLSRVPAYCDAIILENSAISRDLQHLAADWLKPDLIILTNTFSDHTELWGQTDKDAFIVLVCSIPDGVPVITSRQTIKSENIREVFERKKCPVHTPDMTYENYSEEFKSMAAITCNKIGLDGFNFPAPVNAFRCQGEFRILKKSDFILACAFAANDIVSTNRLWENLEWMEKDTLLWFHNRADRPGRFMAFRFFRDNLPWKKVICTGDHPFRSLGKATFLGNPKGHKFIRSLKAQVFGCGNISGLPLEIIACMEEGRS